jgi:hypothetical protein
VPLWLPGIHTGTLPSPPTMVWSAPGIRSLIVRLETPFPPSPPRTARSGRGTGKAALSSVIWAGVVLPTVAAGQRDTGPC